MLTTFRENPASAFDETVIGIEEELRGELIPGVPDLLARIDLLTTTSDALVITDFKKQPAVAGLRGRPKTHRHNCCSTANSLAACCRTGKSVCVFSS